jgi:hypothetical protein
VPWSTLCRADWVRDDPVLTTRCVRLRELIRRYIADVAAQEWPMMAQGTANLRAIPGVLAEGSPRSQGHDEIAGIALIRERLSA